MRGWTVAVGRRVGASLLALLVMTMLVFLAVQVLPGNVADAVLGPQHDVPARVVAITHSLDLHASLPARYVHWLLGMLHGDFGDSSAALAQGEHVSVWSIIGTPLRNSAILAGIAFVIFVPLSLLLGTLAARRPDGIVSRVTSSFGLAVAALPEFLVGSVLVLLFFSWLDLLPPVALEGAGQTPFSKPDALVLPVLTALAAALAFGIRLTRAAMLEVLSRDYILMARLNGYSERRVLVRHALRNALPPILQAFALAARYLIGGLIVIESVFTYPGIGTQLVVAVQDRDVQEIAVIATLLGAVSVGLSLAVDLAVLFLVPRLRTAPA